MRAWTIARLGGITLSAHPALALYVIAGAMLGHANVLRTLMPVLCLHEAAHVVMAKCLGLGVECLEFMPFGGVARVEGVRDVAPWQEACVALAGPACNLLLILGAWGGMRIGWWSGQSIQTFVRCNLMLMLFNLFPALPLDGGRFIRAVLSPWLGFTRSTRLLSLIGMVLAACLLALGVAGACLGSVNLTLFLSGAYLFYAAAIAREEPAALFVHRLSGRAMQLEQAGSLPVRWLAVPADLPIARVPSRLSARSYHMLLVMEGTLAPQGVVTEDCLLDALHRDQRQSVGELLAQRGWRG